MDEPGGGHAVDPLHHAAATAARAPPGSGRDVERPRHLSAHGHLLQPGAIDRRHRGGRPHRVGRSPHHQSAPSPEERSQQLAVRLHECVGSTAAGQRDPGMDGRTASAGNLRPLPAPSGRRRAGDRPAGAGGPDGRRVAGQSALRPHPRIPHRRQRGGCYRRRRPPAPRRRSHSQPNRPVRTAASRAPPSAGRHGRR